VSYFKLKEIAILWALALFGVILALPYQYTLQRGFIDEELTQFVYFGLGQAAIFAGFLFIIVLVGQAFAEKSGLDAPVLSDLLNKRPVKARLKKIASFSVVSGVAVGMITVFLEWFFFRPLIPQLTLAVNIPVWQSFLASFYGGITEEVMLRFFVMSLLVWAITQGLGKKEKTDKIVWSAIVLAALIFGLAHLPVTAQIVPMTALVIIRSFALNGLAGVAFGYLYWKNGLESAMLAHFSMDIVLHMIYPLWIR
jgi:membrane protease YdiL (CAAX protease family)